AGLAYAVLVGLGLASVMEGVATASFGHRQVGAAALALVLSVGLGGQVVQAAAGSWAIGGPELIPGAEPLIARSAGPAYRLLWLGRSPAPHGPLRPEAPPPRGLPRFPGWTPSRRRRIREASWPPESRRRGWCWCPTSSTDGGAPVPGTAASSVPSAPSDGRSA